MMQALSAIAKMELRWPKVGTEVPCSICNKPNAFRFLGRKRVKGKWKGQWETLSHPLGECVEMRMRR